MKKAPFDMDREHYLRTFSDLLYDSVYLLYFAFDLNQEDYKDNVIKFVAG